MLLKHADGSTTSVALTVAEIVDSEQPYLQTRAWRAHCAKLTVDRLLARKAARLADERRSAAQRSAPSLADLARRLRELKG